MNITEDKQENKESWTPFTRPSPLLISKYIKIAGVLVKIGCKHRDKRLESFYDIYNDRVVIQYYEQIDGRNYAPSNSIFCTLESETKDSIEIIISKIVDNLIIYMEELRRERSKNKEKGQKP